MVSEQNLMEPDPRRERSDERAASAQMRKDLQEIRSVRNHIYFVATVCLIGTAFLGVQAWSGQESGSAGGAPLALLGGIGALTLSAILVVERWPVPVTLVLALLSTPGAVMALWVALARSEYRHLQHLLYAVYFWGVYCDAVRPSRLAKAHPDSYSAQIMRGASRDESDGFRAQSLEAHRRYKLWERRVVLVLFVVLARFLVVGGLGVWRSDT